MNRNIENRDVRVKNCSVGVNHELVPGVIKEETTCRAGMKANLAVPTKTGPVILICNSTCPHCQRV